MPSATSASGWKAITRVGTTELISMDPPSVPLVMTGAIESGATSVTCTVDDESKFERCSSRDLRRARRRRRVDLEHKVLADGACLRRMLRRSQA